MKLFRTKQIAEIDSYTIKNEPIASVDLMERASLVFVNSFCTKYNSDKKIYLFIGPGNNGGDGLAVARMLHQKGFSCFVYILKITEKLSTDSEVNLSRLKKNKVPVYNICIQSDFPIIPEDAVIIDALFGSGLTRPLKGIAAELVQYLNQQNNEITAIDIPSGLMGEDNTQNIPENIIKATYTLTFQFPKLSFFFAENEKYTGEWTILPIGLHPKAISEKKSEYFYSDAFLIKNFLKKRKKFSHKGNFGHALLIAGSYGKAGAALLASKACIRTGAGLLTTHVPGSSYPIMQTALPEAMVSVDMAPNHISNIPDLSAYNAIGIGPGIGKAKDTQKIFKNLLEKCTVPMILDADALNILSENKSWLKLLAKNTIITPHPREFDRLAGKSENCFERHLKQIAFASKYKIIVVVKGAFTSVAFPDGRCFFNETGNPGMATGGSGDVLTGIILSLLAQNYNPEDAALAGVYIHGLAGDLALEYNSFESLIASDITDNLGKAFLMIHKK